MKILFLFMLPAALLCGCAGVGSEPQSHQDKFTGTTINSTTYNDINDGVLNNLPFYLDMRQEIDDRGTNYFLLIGGYQAAPGPGESLFILADTNRLVFRTEMKFIQGKFGPMFFYPADPESLTQIATASSVELRLITASGHNWERKLYAKNRKNFYDFVTRYVTTNLPPFSATAARVKPTAVNSPKGH